MRRSNGQESDAGGVRVMEGPGIVMRGHGLEILKSWEYR